jgi:prophage regulatory protein
MKAVKVGRAPLCADDVDSRTSQIIRFPELRRRVALSRSTIWRLEAAGRFPRRRRLSERSVGWILSEVEAWLGARPLS